MGTDAYENTMLQEVAGLYHLELTSYVDHTKSRYILSNGRVMSPLNKHGHKDTPFSSISRFIWTRSLTLYVKKKQKTSPYP